MVGRELDLDDMRADQRRDLRGIGGDVDGGLAVLADRLAARIGPDHRGDALGGGFLAHLHDLFVHVDLRIRARVDGEADGGAAKAQRIIDAGGDSLVLAAGVRHQAVGAVALQDGRDLAGKGVGAGFQHPQRGGIGVQPGIDGQLVMVMGVIAGGVRGEGAGRAVLEALIDRQDDHLAGAAELAFHQHPAEVALHAGIVALVIRQDLLNDSGRAHCRLLDWNGLARRSMCACGIAQSWWR